MRAKLGLSVESVKHKGRKAAPGESRHSSGGSRHSLDGPGATGDGSRLPLERSRLPRDGLQEEPLRRGGERRGIEEGRVR